MNDHRPPVHFILLVALAVAALATAPAAAVCSACGVYCPGSSVQVSDHCSPENWPGCSIQCLDSQHVRSSEASWTGDTGGPITLTELQSASACTTCTAGCEGELQLGW